MVRLLKLLLKKEQGIFVVVVTSQREDLSSRYLLEPLQQGCDRQTVGDGGVVLSCGLRVEERKLEKGLEAVLGEVLPESDAAGAVVAQRHRRVDRSLVEEDHDLADEIRRNLENTAEE